MKTSATILMTVLLLYLWSVHSEHKKNVVSPSGVLLCKFYACRYGHCLNNSVKFDPVSLVCSWTRPLAKEGTSSLVSKPCGTTMCPPYTRCVQTKMLQGCLAEDKYNHYVQTQTPGMRTIVTLVKLGSDQMIYSLDLITKKCSPVHTIKGSKATITLLRSFGPRVIWCESTSRECGYIRLETPPRGAMTVERLKAPRLIIDIAADENFTNVFAAVKNNIVKPLDRRFKMVGSFIFLAYTPMAIAYFHPKRLLCITYKTRKVVQCMAHDNQTDWRNQTTHRVQAVQSFSFDQQVGQLIITGHGLVRILKNPLSKNSWNTVVHLNATRHPLYVFMHRQNFIAIINRDVLVTDTKGNVLTQMRLKSKAKQGLLDFMRW